jgi:hypothetical protein
MEENCLNESLSTNNIDAHMGGVEGYIWNLFIKIHFNSKISDTKPPVFLTTVKEYAL